MADPIQQTTQINLPNPRTPLIVVKDGIGYPTREFMAMLRQFSVRVGGTSPGVDIISPDVDIVPPLNTEAPQDVAFALEPLIPLGLPALQDLASEIAALEASVARAGFQPDQSSPLAFEMTLGVGFEPV